MSDHPKGERACDLAAKMARALSDLHAFAAIEAITEHSLFSPDSHAAEQSIRNICQREMRRCAREHDRAEAALQLGEGNG
jgi:hypothetical protein